MLALSSPHQMETDRRLRSDDEDGLAGAFDLRASGAGAEEVEGPTASPSQLDEGSDLDRFVGTEWRDRERA